MSKRQSNGTGTFKIRKDGTVEYKVSLGSGINGAPIRKSFYGKYKADAIAKYKEWLKESGNVPIEKVETVKEWAYLWLELYKKNNVAYGTYHDYKMYIDNHIVPALGRLKLTQVRPAHIKQFYNDKNRVNLSQSAIRYINITLKGIFDSAVKNHYCNESPIGIIKKPKSCAEQIKVFSPEQIKSILSDAPHHENGICVLLLLYTGLRMGELLALHWSDIKDGVITVRQSLAKAEGGGYELKSTKSGKVRYVGVTQNLQNIFDGIPKTSLYVLSGKGGNPVTIDGFSWRYKKFFTDTNNFYLSPHKCRHTYATYLIKGGADLRSVQDLLGHSSVSVTEIYTHVDTDDIKNNVRKLGY